jgi:hypothetical protein
MAGSAVNIVVTPQPAITYPTSEPLGRCGNSDERFWMSATS